MRLQFFWLFLEFNGGSEQYKIAKFRNVESLRTQSSYKSISSAPLRFKFPPPNTEDTLPFYESLQLLIITRTLTKSLHNVSASKPTTSRPLELQILFAKVLFQIRLLRQDNPPCEPQHEHGRKQQHHSGIGDQRHPRVRHHVT